MSRETLKELKIYIKSRKNMPEPRIELGKMLSIHGMEGYTFVCANRIASAFLIDGNHVAINFPKPEILLDKIGQIKCRDILSGYISVEMLDEYEDAMFGLSGEVAAKNTALKTLRNYTKKELLAAIEEPIETEEIKVGQVYTLQSEMKVRTGAGTGFRAKAFAELTENGRQHDADKDGCLDKGTQVTCKEIKPVGADIWMHTVWVDCGGVWRENVHKINSKPVWREFTLATMLFLVNIGQMKN